jgi:heat shock protein HtpX
VNWETDWELRARMAAVLTVLGGLLVGFALALHWVLTDVLSAVLTLFLTDSEVRAGGETVTRLPDGSVVVGDWLGLGLLVALFAAAVVSELVLSEKFTGEDGAVRSAGDAPADLRRRLARLAQTADVPEPTLVVAETETPKAYTTGVLPGNATVVVSTGLLDVVSDDELDAVLAHELAHVKNRDASVMTAASLVEIVGQWLLTWFERDLDEIPTDRHGNPREETGRAPLGGFAHVFHFFAVRPIAWAFWWVGRGLTRLLSQYREFAADRGAAAITGSPAAVSSALATLDRAASEAPETDRRARATVQSAFYVVPVPTADPDAEETFDASEYTGFAVEDREQNAIEKLDEAATDATAEAVETANSATDFSTHPATSERIARLRRLEREF